MLLNGIYLVYWMIPDSILSLKVHKGIWKSPIKVSTYHLVKTCIFFELRAINRKKPVSTNFIIIKCRKYIVLENLNHLCF